MALVRPIIGNWAPTVHLWTLLNRSFVSFKFSYSTWHTKVNYSLKTEEILNGKCPYSNIKLFLCLASLSLFARAQLCNLGDNAALSRPHYIPKPPLHSPPPFILELARRQQPPFAKKTVTCLSVLRPVASLQTD